MATRIKRTTLRSSKGKKLYAVRRDGKFQDIQTYERAHRADLAKKSAAERKSDRARKATKSARKTTKKPKR